MNGMWKLLFIAMMVCSFTSAASALGRPETTSNVTLSGPSSCWGNGIVSAGDGDYVVAGGLASDGDAADAFVWHSQDDPEGDWWYETYGWDDSRDIASDITGTGDGYVFAGYTNHTTNGRDDAWVAKVDRQGDLAWSRTFGGSGSDAAMAIAGTPDGGCIVAGYTRVPGRPLDDAWVAKLDPDGDEDWNRTYGGAGDETAYDIARLPDGYLVTGTTNSTAGGSYDLWALKLDAGGEPLWSRTYGNMVGDERGEACAATADGYVLAGWTAQPGGEANAYVVNLDEDGNEVWTRTYDANGDDRAHSILEVEGGYVFAGSTAESGSDRSDAWIVHVDGDGSTVWEESYGGPWLDTARELIATPDGLAFTGILGYASGTGGAKDAAWAVGLAEAGGMPETTTRPAGPAATRRTPATTVPTTGVPSISRPATGLLVAGSTPSGGMGQFVIDNEAGTHDAVAVLTRSGSLDPIVAVYIRQGDSHTIDRIRDGSYDLYFALGEDWDPVDKAFATSASEQRFPDPFVFDTSEVQAGNRVVTHYPIVTVTLYPAVEDGVTPVDVETFPEL